MSVGASLDLEALLDSGRLRPFQIAIIALCAAVAMIDGFDTQSIAFVAPAVAAAWQVDASTFGSVFGAGLFGGLIGAMIFGVAGDRLGRKPILLAAILLFSVVCIVTPLTGSIPALIAARFVTGLGLGGAIPMIIAITSEYAPRRMRTTVVSLMFCGFPLGAVIGGIASAKLIPAFGWPSVFYVGGAIPLLLLPALAAFLPESVRFLAMKKRTAAITEILERMACAAQWSGELAPARTEARSPVARLFTEGRAPVTLLLWTTLFLSLLLTYFLINWIPLLASQSGIGIESAILGVAALNLGAIVGCIALGRLADKRGATVVVAVGFALGAAAVAAIGLAGQSGASLIAATFLAGFFSIGAQMCTVAMCAGFYDTALRATGVGWSMGVSRIGAIVGPIVGGLLIGAGVAASTLFIVAGLVSLGAAAAVLAIRRFAAASRFANSAGASGQAPSAAATLQRRAG